MLTKTAKSRTSTKFTLPGNYIKSPGKFEGESPVIVALWDLAMESSSDETIYDGDTEISIFLIDDDLRAEFPEVTGTHAIAIWESDQGFVMSEWFATKEELEAAVLRCEESEDIEA